MTRTLHTILIVFACFAIRWLFQDFLNPYLPTEFFFLGAMLVALRYGYIPGFISLSIGWLIGLYFFVEPYGQFTGISKSDIVLTVDDFVTGVAGIAVMEYLQRTRYSQKLMLMVSNSRYRSLLKLDNHRIHHQRQSSIALRQATELLIHIDRVLLFVDVNGQQQLLPLFANITGSMLGGTDVGWLESVHLDDRQYVEKETGMVRDGLRDTRELRFRLANGSEASAYVECIFRTIHLGSHKQVYALSLKPAPI